MLVQQIIYENISKFHLEGFKIVFFIEFFVVSGFIWKHQSLNI